MPSYLHAFIVFLACWPLPFVPPAPVLGFPHPLQSSPRVSHAPYFCAPLPASLVPLPSAPHLLPFCVCLPAVMLLDPLPLRISLSFHPFMHPPTFLLSIHPSMPPAPCPLPGLLPCFLALTPDPNLLEAPHPQVPLVSWLLTVPSLDLCLLGPRGHLASWPLRCQ